MNNLSFWVSIATLVTAVTGLINIIVLREQNKNSLKPDLIILENKISLFWKYSIYGKIYIPIYCVRTESLEESQCYIKEKETIKETNGIGFDLVNIGKESAKNVKIIWEFDYLELISIIKKFDENDEFKIEFMDSNFDVLFFHDKMQNVGLGIPASKITSIQYLLPIDDRSSGTEIEFPRWFRYIYATLLKLNQSYSNPELHKYIDNLVINLTIQYEDIAGSKYKSKFSIKFNSVISYIAEDDGNMLKRAIDLEMKVTKML